MRKVVEDELARLKDSVSVSEGFSVKLVESKTLLETVCAKMTSLTKQVARTNTEKAVSEKIFAKCFSRVREMYGAFERVLSSVTSGRNLDALFVCQVHEWCPCCCSSVGARNCKLSPAWLRTFLLNSACALTVEVGARLLCDGDQYSLEKYREYKL